MAPVNKQTDTALLRKAGTFTDALGRQIYGELTLAGPASKVYFHDPNPFLLDTPDRTITGVLQDLTKVSLIDCLSPGLGGSRGPRGAYSFAELFAHLIALGDEHIRPGDKKVAEVFAYLDDAPILFSDFDTFGIAEDASQLIAEISKSRAEKRGSGIPIGSQPKVFYFSGKLEIVAIQTKLGRFSARHNPGYGFPTTRGFRLDNAVSIHVSFEERLTIADAIERLYVFVRFLSLLVGRQQNVERFGIKIMSESQQPSLLRLHHPWLLNAKIKMMLLSQRPVMRLLDPPSNPMNLEMS